METDSSADVGCAGCDRPPTSDAWRFADTGLTRAISIMAYCEFIFHRIICLIMVQSHTPCAGMGWAALRCAGNSMYFNGGVHTLSYQRIPSYPVPAQRVCDCTIINIQYIACLN